MMMMNRSSGTGGESADSGYRAVYSLQSTVAEPATLTPVRGRSVLEEAEASAGAGEDSDVYILYIFLCS